MITRISSLVEPTGSQYPDLIEEPFMVLLIPKLSCFPMNEYLYFYKTAAKFCSFHRAEHTRTAYEVDSIDEN